MIYLASPFFNPKQIERLEFVKTVLDKQGIDYFSPMDEFICPPNADSNTRKRTFEGNVVAIGNSDYILAITDEKDMGTIWEAGYAYGVGVPVVYYCETLPEGAPFNLMLAESAFRVITSRKELEELDLNGIGYQEYTGSIE